MSLTAIYAVGENGEFGLQGKLPWGSFKEELEVFYATLRSIYPMNIIIGAKTWIGLPNSVKQKLADNVRQIFIRANRPLPDYTEFDVTPISNIGDTLPPIIKNIDTVVLGGSSLLMEMYQYGHIEQAYVSTIISTNKLKADSWIDKSILDYNYESTRLVLNTGSNSDNSLRFVQELVTY